MANLGALWLVFSFLSNAHTILLGPDDVPDLSLRNSTILGMGQWACSMGFDFHSYHKGNGDTLQDDKIPVFIRTQMAVE